MRQTLSLIGVLTLILCAGCQQGTGRGASALGAPSSLAILADRDYSTFVKSCHYVPCDASTIGMSPYLKGALDSINEPTEGISRRSDLSPKEKQVLGLFVMPGNTYAITSMMLYEQVSAYYGEFGKLPSSGAECLKYWYHGPRAGLLDRISERARMNIVAALIDPATGKLYASFDNPQESFGFHFEFQPLADNELPNTGFPSTVGPAVKSGGCGCQADASANAKSAQTKSAQAKSAETQPAASSFDRQVHPDPAWKHVVRTEQGPMPVNWRCTVTRYGETPGTVLERQTFIF